MEQLAAFLQRNEGRWAPVTERSRETQAIAVIALRETGRRWFIVSAEIREGRHVLIGYEPRCRYHAPGDGWFSLASDFFVRAARGTGDKVDVHPLSPGVPVGDLDVDDAF